MLNHAKPFVANLVSLQPPCCHVRTNNCESRLIMISFWLMLNVEGYLLTLTAQGVMSLAIRSHSIVISDGIRLNCPIAVPMGDTSGLQHPRRLSQGSDWSVEHS